VRKAFGEDRFQKLENHINNYAFASMDVSGFDDLFGYMMFLNEAYHHIMINLAEIVARKQNFKIGFTQQEQLEKIVISKLSKRGCDLSHLHPSNLFADEED
jgi:hypothetical protein